MTPRLIIGGEAVTIACRLCMCFVPQAQTGGQGGECRKNPPTVVIMSSRVVGAGGMPANDAKVNTVFPYVPNDLYCMQFLPNPEVATVEPVAATGAH